MRARDRSPRTSEASARAAGICEDQACQSDRDSAHGQHTAEGPGTGVAAGEPGDAVAEPRQRVPGGAGAACADVGGETEDGLGGGVGALGDQPRGRTATVDLKERPVLGEHLPVDRRDREVHALAEEPRERGVGLLERRVALTERPGRAGEPVGRVAVGGVRELLRLGAGVQGAVGLQPQHHVAGVRAARGLQVGQAAQHLERRVAAVRRAGLPPVAEVDHGCAGHVVGVERALAPGVGGGVVRPAADALERPPDGCRRRSRACRGRAGPPAGRSCVLAGPAA